MVEIAAAAVAVLAPYARDAGASIAQRAGDAAFDAARSLYRFVKVKLAGSEADERALARLEEQPDDPAVQSVLEDALQRLVADDPRFAEQLQELVQQAATNRALVQFVTEVHPDARVGQLTNIHSAGIVQLGNVTFD
jgi:DNA gyrase/topoisomerase IV subunit B